MRDRLRGTYRTPEDPNTFFIRAGRTLRDVNFLRMLGGMTLSAIPDIARPIAVNGLRPLGRAMKALAFAPQEFIVRDEYCGAGYGVLTSAEREAIQLMARTEGVLVDPVYTARALAGLIDLIRRGTFTPQENVCFWHTGGTPGIFAYGEALLE